MIKIKKEDVSDSLWKQLVVGCRIGEPDIIEVDVVGFTFFDKDESIEIV